ncbi:MAG: DNA-binding response regulator [Bacteroidetes bacterium HGW-Bacteroidetes-17]|jgi:DNA-binding NarL/FixJ family response regulator|nr:MAG: DNA-binding response regulator [Bacteroidetes bacterium HGW-Bacteroidetes-17]
MSIKIVIADDHQLFREGLVKLLSNSSEIEVIAEAENGEDAILKAKDYQPDIMLMDIGMPILNGIEATLKIRNNYPNIKILALSMHIEKDYIKDILDACASGYLLKNCTYNQLIDAINSVYLGKKYLSEEVTEIVIQDYLAKKEEITKDENTLSNREIEILKLFAEGNSSREISEKLFISIKTVGTHKQHILKKLDLRTNADMVRYSIKEGIIKL